VFAGELGAAVGAAGCGVVVLAVGPVEVAAEDVVGGDMNEPRVLVGCCFGEVPGGYGVDGVGGVLVGLGGVDGGVGGAVDDDVGLRVGDGAAYGVGVCDVEVIAADGGDVFAGRGEVRPTCR
jgi:hypothetical protein